MYSLTLPNYKDMNPSLQEILNKYLLCLAGKRNTSIFILSCLFTCYFAWLEYLHQVLTSKLSLHVFCEGFRTSFYTSECQASQSFYGFTNEQVHKLKEELLLSVVLLFILNFKHKVKKQLLSILVITLLQFSSCCFLFLFL